MTLDGLHRGLVRMNLREAVVLVEGAVADSVAYYEKTCCCAKDNSHVLK